MSYFSLLSNTGNAIDLPLVGRFFSIFMAFIFIALLTWYVTKFIAGARFQRINSNNLKLIESVPVGYQSMIQLVKVGKGKYIIIGVTKDKITFLSDVDEEMLDFKIQNIDINRVPFEKYLKNFLNKGNTCERKDDKD